MKRELVYVLVGGQLREEVQTVFPKYLLPPLALTEDVSEASALVAIDRDVTSEILDAAGESLRLIGRVSPVLEVAPTEVPVVELPRLSDMGVAELTVLLILALELRLMAIAGKTARAEWVPGRDQPILTDQRAYKFNWVGEELGILYRKTVGIVGLGKIGRSVAERLRPFGVRLLYTQRSRLAEDDERSLDLTWRSFEDLLRESDIVTFHQRFQDGPGGNEHQLDAAEMQLMKPTAAFVNTARGRLVDEDALVAALQEKRIAGAGLDVFRYEPLPPDHPLLELANSTDGNVILTAHVAGGSVDDYWRLIAEEVARQLNGPARPD